MESKTILLMVLFFAMALCMAARTCAAPMGTEFTYQGRLYDANSPAEGTYDLLFELYNYADPCIGTQQGNTLIIDDVDVVDGYFTVGLDFGGDPNIFNGDGRWLQINVRPGNSMSMDPNDLVMLNPRQEVTPTPYSLHTRGILVDSSGNVDVNGSMVVREGVEVGTGTIEIGRTANGTPNRIRFTAAGPPGQPPPPYSGVIDTDPCEAMPLILNAGATGNIQLNPTSTGNVGIRTNNPSTELEVNGTVTADAFVGNGAGLIGVPSDTDWTEASGNVCRVAGNVGIGTTSPNSSKGSDGYLDAQDVYLRDSGKWASESGGAANVYRSEWFAVEANGIYYEEHGLGTYPDIVQVYIAEDANGSGWCYVNVAQRCDHEDTHWNNGVWMEAMSTTGITVKCGDHVTPFSCGWDGCGDDKTHYCRIVAVKY